MSIDAPTAQRSDRFHPSQAILYVPAADRFDGEPMRADAEDWLCELIDNGAVPGQEIEFVCSTPAGNHREIWRLDLCDVTTLRLVKVRRVDG